MRSFDCCCVVARALVALVSIALCVAVGGAQVAEKMTPALLTVQDAPVPFMGSDGRVHLVYELWVANFSSAEVTVEKVDVLGDGSVLQSLGAAEITRACRWPVNESRRRSWREVFRRCCFSM